MMLFFHEHRRGVIIGAAVGLVTALAVAIAAWIITSNNRGYVKAGELKPLTHVVLARTDLDGTLLPGGTSDIFLRLSNPNPADVTITRAELDPDQTTKIASDGGTSCPPTAVFLNGSTGKNTAITGLSLGPIPANATDFNVSIPSAAGMNNDAPTECQGVRFEYRFRLTIQAGS